MIHKASSKASVGSENVIEADLPSLSVPTTVAITGSTFPSPAIAMSLIAAAVKATSTPAIGSPSLHVASSTILYVTVMVPSSLTMIPSDADGMASTTSGIRSQVSGSMS
jgi:hypothetical protein